MLALRAALAGSNELLQETVSAVVKKLSGFLASRKFTAYILQADMVSYLYRYLDWQFANRGFSYGLNGCSLFKLDFHVGEFEMVCVQS